ncbi:MAG: gliding motility-associated C-terminal domain-containing protein [Cyclobacteriaceae bacterium]
MRDTIEIRGHIEFTVPNLITPNGDPQNEYFTIDEGMMGSTLLIFNRWGKQIYAADNYNNDWNADNLESAVYYYAIPEFCIKGWIHVMR